MPIHYLSDDIGNPIAVQIPISEWMRMKEMYPDIDIPNGDIPQWHKDLIDERLKLIAKHPERLYQIDSLFEELDKEV